MDAHRAGYIRRVPHRSARIFALTAALLGLPVLLAVLSTGQLDLHATINRVHAAWADPLFIYGTHLADGLVALAMGLVLLFFRWRWFLLFTIGTAGSAIVVQFLKHAVFADHDRPSMFMDGMPGLRLVPGVEMLHHNSFPSGHSACAFSVCFALSVIIGRGGWAAVLALIAAMLAWSRVYLSQHFAEDTLCGAFIGTIGAWLAYRWLYVGAFSRRPWLDGRPLRPGYRRPGSADHE